MAPRSTKPHACCAWPASTAPGHWRVRPGPGAGGARTGKCWPACATTTCRRLRHLRHSQQRQQPGHHHQLPHEGVGVEQARRRAVPAQRAAFVLRVGGSSFNTSGDAYSLSAANVNIPPEQSVNLETRRQARLGRQTFHHPPGGVPLDQIPRAQHRPGRQPGHPVGQAPRGGREIDLTGRLTREWEMFGSFMWMPIAVIDVACPRKRHRGARATARRSRRCISGTFWNTYQLTPKLAPGRWPQLPGRADTQPQPGLGSAWLRHGGPDGGVRGDVEQIPAQGLPDQRRQQAVCQRSLHRPLHPRRRPPVPVDRDA